LLDIDVSKVPEQELAAALSYATSESATYGSITA
jgi:hypothetical protein